MKRTVPSTSCYSIPSLALDSIIFESAHIQLPSVTPRVITKQSLSLTLTRNSLSHPDVAFLPALATQASNKFCLTSLEERQVTVKKALKLISDRQDILARELTEQMGRPIAYTAKEIATAVVRGEYLSKISSDALKDTQGEPEMGFKTYIRKTPVGPVLVLFAALVYDTVGKEYGTCSSVIQFCNRPESLLTCCVP